MIRTTH